MDKKQRRKRLMVLARKKRNAVGVVSAVILALLVATLPIPQMAYNNGASSSNEDYMCGGSSCHGFVSAASISMSASKLNPVEGEQITVTVTVAGSEASGTALGVFLLRSLTTSGDQPSVDGWVIVSDPSGSTTFNYYEEASVTGGVVWTWTLNAPTTAGTYYLYASEHHGNGERYYKDDTVGLTFTVLSPPNNWPEARDLTVQGFAPATTGIMHITDHTPDLGWTFFDQDGGDTQQQYDVRVGTAPGLSNMWSTGPQAGGASVETYAGSSLQDGVDYWFGIRVQDGTDWSVWNETQFHMNSVEARSLTVQAFGDGTQGIIHITDHTPDLGWSYWDAEAGDVQAQYDVRVGTAPGLSDMWAPGIQPGAATMETYAGAALVDGSDYWFAVRLFDSYEWSVWNETQFHMNSLSEAQDLTVQGFLDGTQGIIHVTDHSPDLGWSFSDPEVGDTQQQYDVRVGTASGLSDMWSPGPQIGPGSSILYSGLPLLDGIDYWFGVGLFDGFEWGSWNETMFHMNSLPEAQSLTVQGYANATAGILHITDHTPDLGWAFSDGEVGDTQQEYEVRVGTLPGLSDMWAPGPQPGAATLEMYSGAALVDGSDYWFGVRLNDSYEWSPWNETQFHMNSLPPIPVPPLSPPDDSNIPSSPAQTLGWTSGGADAEGDTVTYYWYVDTDNPPVAPYLANDSSMATSSTPFPTSPSTDYYWYVNATDSWEWNATIVWNFTTSTIVNNPPEAMDLTVQGFANGTSGIVHITDHFPDLNWSFSDPDGGDIQQDYEVRVGTSPGLSDKWAPGPQPGGTTSVIYGGAALLDGTDYWFGIKVYDGNTWSQWNETLFHMNSVEARTLKVQGYDVGTLGIGHLTNHLPDLNWSYFDGEIGDTQQQYDVRIGTGPGLSDMWDPGPQAGAIETVPYAGLPLLDGTDYWFGISVFDGLEWSAWNETMFHMNSLPPSPVPPLSPPDDSNIPSSPAQTMSWTSGGLDLEGDTVSYDWFVDVDNPPAAPYLANASTSSLSSDPFATSPSTDYYWIVNATDGWEWNSTIVWNFTTSAVVNNPPEALDLTVQDFAPGTAEIAHILEHMPDLNWTFSDPDIPDTQQEYDVRVGTASGLSDMWATGPQAGAVNSVSYNGLPLLDGVDYWFGIKVYDGSTWSAWNETMFHMNALPPAPIPPLNPPDDGNIPDSPAQTLSWTSGGPDVEGDIVSHSWFVDTDNPPVAPYIANGSTSGTSSTSFATSPGTEYYWMVNSTDGWEWNSTVVWNFTTSGAANTPPEAIGLLVQGFAPGTSGILHATDHTPDLNWSFSDADMGDVQQQYDVRIGTSSGLGDIWAPGPQIGAQTTETYAGPPLLDGADYWFGVSVYDSYDWSQWNETMFHMNTVPESTDIAVQAFAEASAGILHITNHTPELNWTFADTDSGDIQLQFEPRIGTGPGASDMWNPGPQAGAATSLAYAGQPLLDGTDYWFGVRLHDGYEWGQWNETMFHMNSVPESIDLTVQGFASGTSGIQRITDSTPDLGWTFSDPEVADVQLEYELRVGTAIGLSDMWGPGIRTGATSSVTYAGLALLEGTDYWLGARLNDGFEWGQWNETIFHMNGPPVLDWTGEPSYASDGLNPESGDISTSFSYRIEYVDAEGDPPLSGTPNVHIEKGGIGISGSPFAMIFVSGSPSTGSIYRFATTLAEGSDYSYYFTASDDQGYAASPTPEQTGPSVGAEPVVDTTPPATPTNVSVTTPEGRGKLTISWDVNSEADLAGYRIYRSTTSYASVNGSGYKFVTSLVGSETSFTDIGLLDETTYYYVVRAFDVNGNESPNSVEVSGETEAGPIQPKPDDGQEWLIWLIPLVAIVLFVLFIMLMSKRRKGAPVEEEREVEEPEIIDDANQEELAEEEHRLGGEDETDQT
jgi:hypothetical protein